MIKGTKLYKTLKIGEGVYGCTLTGSDEPVIKYYKHKRQSDFRCLLENHRLVKTDEREGVWSRVLNVAPLMFMGETLNGSIRTSEIRGWLSADDNLSR